MHSGKTLIDHNRRYHVSSNQKRTQFQLTVALNVKKNYLNAFKGRFSFSFEPEFCMQYLINIQHIENMKRIKQQTFDVYINVLHMCPGMYYIIS